jgi:drug/metabolite transporter (DMT)-like permease
MRRPPALSAPGFGSAWFALCVAFALHIIDESSSGFLAVCSPSVIFLRERWRFPMPRLEFREWLFVLTTVCGLLFCLTPVAARGMRGFRPLAWFYALLMFFNGLGQTLLSILGYTVAAATFPRPVFGFLSSPFLFVGSLWLMARLRRTAQVDFQLPMGY